MAFLQSLIFYGVVLLYCVISATQYKSAIKEFSVFSNWPQKSTVVLKTTVLLYYSCLNLIGRFIFQ
jgi:hypothetical protein